ncbi:DUF1178 family protein [Terasakiella sp. A23]|uniref:DUF1178 family protein n=1 Tax=Terasakiella sp. FCG-A23 TaxID=3080561 RepID=UPI002953FDC2|nr:DUF1178 family protein [Terasakiella sp. A23]MDV7337989.1 DUF1178 family protein [Terasakiella sp. A23]
MIRYQLLCEHNHEFEAWFRDSSAFDEQAERGEVQCPFCGNDNVRKAVMAPAVASRKEALISDNQQVAIEAAEKAADDMRDGADPQEVAQVFMEVVNKLQKHVEDTCDYVGDDFADEARAIHYGDAEERGIYGEATPEETEELRDEGIEVAALPKLASKDQAN